MSGLRTIIRKLGPGWLVRDSVTLPDGTTLEVDNRVLYAIALLYDALITRIQLGVKARFPGAGATEDSLVYIGRDRLIARGPAETREVYEGRLPGAIDKHRTRGNAWRMMEQIRAYCSPHAVRVRVWTERGKVYTLDRDESTSVDGTTDWDWDGSALADAWSRFWVIIYPTDATPREPWDRVEWGAENWGSFYWGSTATKDDVQAIRTIVETWKPEGTHCRNIIIAFGDTDFDPTDAAPPLPDGTWGPETANVGGEQVPTRNPNAAYWPGSRGPTP